MLPNMPAPFLPTAGHCCPVALAMHTCIPVKGAPGCTESSRSLCRSLGRCWQWEGWGKQGIPAPPGASQG